MRILITVPHYFGSAADKLHGSGQADSAQRIRHVSTCIAGLHQSLGQRQGLLHPPTREIQLVNQNLAGKLDVVVCTTCDAHLLDQLTLEEGSFEHHATEADPKLLGFECHAVLRDRFGQYDCYGYIEDDLLLQDSLLLTKLSWFSRHAGSDALLQPNRYEVTTRGPVHKLYLDGPLKDNHFQERYQDVTDRPTIELESLGQTLRFERPLNPHSGCFFLTAEQMQRWITLPWFLDRDCGFWGPLESAATLGMMRTFRIYKAALPNAGFLEIRHLDQRYLGKRVNIAQTPDAKLSF